MATLNAVIVKLSIGMLSNTRQDPSITAGVKALHKLAGNAGKWVKNKLPEEALSPVREIAGKCRQEHYRMTLPWDEGYALLPNAARNQYEARMAELKEEFREAVDAFIEAYPAWIGQSRIMHDGTWNEDDYPGVQHIPQDVLDWEGLSETQQTAVRAALAHEFSFTTLVLPVPSAGHFDNTLRGLYGAALEDTVQARADAAVQETWNRLLAPVRHMAEKLADGDKPVFRDSLVDNIREVVSLIPSLNLTGDARLREAAEQIRSRLATMNPDTLRASKVVRREAVQAANQLLSTFGSYAGRKITK